MRGSSTNCPTRTYLEETERLENGGFLGQKVVSKSSFWSLIDSIIISFRKIPCPTLQKYSSRPTQHIFTEHKTKTKKGIKILYVGLGI